MARNPFAALFPSMMDVQAFVQNAAEVSPRDFPPAVTEKDLATAHRMEPNETSAPEIIRSSGHVNSGIADDCHHSLAAVLEDIFRVTVSGKKPHYCCDCVRGSLRLYRNKLRCD